MTPSLIKKDEALFALAVASSWRNTLFINRTGFIVALALCTHGNAVSVESWVTVTSKTAK